MKTGIDLGYYSEKVVATDKMFSFPSIAGSISESKFDLNGMGPNTFAVETEKGTSYLVGEDVSLQSRYMSRQQDRDWITSDEYKVLLLTALTEITKGSRVDVDLVTGLPVNFYDDKDLLRDNLLGEHRIRRLERRNTQVFVIKNIRVIPQPFGTVFSVVLNGHGKATEDSDLATGSVGVIDVGSRTTNLLTVNRMREIGVQTESIDSGAWKVISSIKRQILSEYPDYDNLKDHMVAEAVKDRWIGYYDETLDLTELVEDELGKLVSEIMAAARNLWGKGASLKRVLITGGGALLAGERIKSQFRHAQVVPNPMYANAIGYYKFACRF